MYNPLLLHAIKIAEQDLDQAMALVDQEISYRAIEAETLALDENGETEEEAYINTYHLQAHNAHN